MPDKTHSILVKLEFQGKKKKQCFGVCLMQPLHLEDKFLDISMKYKGHTYTKQVFTVCLKFRINWASLVSLARPGHLTSSLHSIPAQ